MQLESARTEISRLRAGLEGQGRRMADLEQVIMGMQGDVGSLAQTLK